MPSSVAPGQPKRLPRAEREKQMLQAAARLFGEKGYDSTSMDDIAAACGVTKPMVYSYFESKEGLYNAMLRSAGMRLLSDFSGVFDPTDPRNTLRNATRAFLGFVDTFKGSWHMVFSELPHQGREIDVIRTYRREIVKSFSYVLISLSPTSTRTPEALARAVPYAYGWLGTCEQVAQWWLSSGHATRTDAEQTLTVLLEGFMDTVSRQTF